LGQTASERPSAPYREKDPADHRIPPSKAAWRPRSGLCG
jgi:hypothetical protein